MPRCSRLCVGILAGLTDPKPDLACLPATALIIQPVSSGEPTDRARGG
jgi:hypothetical protein